MKFSIDREKLQQRLKDQQEKNSRNSKDPKDSVILKVDAEGKHLFRGVIYPHSQDPSSEPFVERFYHWGFPGGAVFCPKKNAGQDCHLCDFAWDRINANKGNKDVVKKWAQLLPQMSVLIAGKVRGREEEGCKFFRIATREDKPSDNYNKIYGWFMDDDTASWLDPDGGFDVELTYKKPDAKQSKFLKGAKFLLGELTLARKSSSFGSKEEYNEFMKNVPNVDKDIFPRKTTEDTLVVLEKYRDQMAKNTKKSDDSELNQDDGTSTSDDDSSSSTTQDDLAKKLEDLGL